MKALAEQTHQQEFDALREELGSLKEMVADVLLELDRQGRMNAADDLRELPPTRQRDV